MKIHKHHFYLGMILFVFGGIGVFYVSNGGYYPVAFVNKKPILARDLVTVSESAFAFYLRAFDTYKKEPLSEDDAQKLLREVRRATLEKLIEERLVGDELGSRLGAGAESLIDKKLEKAENGNLKEAAVGLYGLDFFEFKKVVLEPEARKEILSDALKEKNEDFTAWLKGAKQNAAVYVFLPGFAWSGATIEAR